MPRQIIGIDNMRLSTTITKKYFEMKMEDFKETGFFIEYKEEKPFWIKRLDSFVYNLTNQDDLDIPIVFLVGSKPHRFKVVSLWLVHKDFIPEKYQSAISTEFAYAIKCVKDNQKL
jgi:hypothetical protein